MLLQRITRSSYSRFRRATISLKAGTNPHRYLATSTSDNSGGCPFAGAALDRESGDLHPRRIIRFLDASGKEQLALQPQENGPASLLSGDLFNPDTLVDTGEAVKWPLSKGCKLLRPIDPPIILGTGLNYHKHATECGLAVPDVPVLAFVKPPSAAQHPNHPIMIPACCDPETPEVDWEVELAIVIGDGGGEGRPCKSVTEEAAMDFVLGYTVANDVSARLWQTDPARTAGQWNKGKGFDTFCPLGPALVLQERGFNPHNLSLSLTVNGEMMQDDSTSDLIFSVAKIVSFLSQDTTLAPGTVILTGTPCGIGMSRDPPQYLAPGDEVIATVEGIGSLSSSVARAAQPLEMMPGPRSAEEWKELSMSFGGNQYDIYAEMQRRYGNMMLLGKDVVGTDIVTIFHPEDIEKGLRKEGPLPRGLGQALLPFMKFYSEHAPNGLNLGRIDGEKWSDLRKAMNQPMMSPKAAQTYIPHLGRVMDECSLHLAANGHDMGDYLPRVTFEMICSVLLDHVPHMVVPGKASELDEKFVHTAKKVFPLMADIMSPDEMPSFLKGESAIYKDEFEPTMLQIMSMGGEYIADLKQRLEEHKNDPNHNVHSSYFAQILKMDILDDHQVNINFSNLIFAGVDTTSNVLQWMMLHIAQNPRVQAKLRAEAEAVLGGGNVASPKDYKALKYHRMVMKEVYRLTPPVFGTARYLPEDTTFGGFQVPKGTMVRMHPLPYLTHPEVWDRPEEFVPERWAKNPAEEEEEDFVMPDNSTCPMGKISDHKFLDVVPFSVGKRMCLGARLAEVEIVAFFSRVIQDYDVILENSNAPPPVPTAKMGMIEPHPSPKYIFQKRNL